MYYSKEKYPPRIRLENMAILNDNDRFRLTLRFRNFTVESDGSIRVFMDRIDVEQLGADCAASLQDDDLLQGKLRAAKISAAEE